jgi:tetratricopeptide (TPR) repeat protein
MFENRSRSIIKLRAPASIVPLLWLWTAVVVAVGLSWAGSEDPLAGLSEKLKGMTPPEQISHLRAYLADGVEDARLHFYLGNAYFAVEKYDSAIAEFQAAVDLDGEYSKAIVNMGIVYDTKGDRRKARAAYSRAIEINPKDVLAYCHLGLSYQSSKQPAKAIEYYDKALAIDPNSAQAHYNLGLAFASAKIFREALIEWNKVIELDPDGNLGKTAAENVQLIKTYMELDN